MPLSVWSPFPYGYLQSMSYTPKGYPEGVPAEATQNQTGGDYLPSPRLILGCFREGGDYMA